MCSKYIAVPVLIRGDKICKGKNAAREFSHTLIVRCLELEMFHELKIVSLLYHGTDVYSRHWRVYNFYSVNKLFNWP